MIYALLYSLLLVCATAHGAANNPNQAEIKALEDQIKQKEKSTEALHAAVRKGCLLSVKQELLKNADPNALLHGNTALDLAVSGGHIAVIKHLLPLTENQTVAEGALRNAASNNNRRVVFCLLQHNNINVDSANAAGETALYLAAQHGHSEMVSYLLDKGANINHRNAQGMSIFDNIILRDQIGAIETIINHTKTKNPTLTAEVMCNKYVSTNVYEEAHYSFHVLGGGTQYPPSTRIATCIKVAKELTEKQQIQTVQK